MIITTTNFRETAKAWAQNNPSVVVNGVKEAHNLTWASVHSEYKVDGRPILAILQLWSNVKQGKETEVIMVTENNWREFVHTWAALFPSTCVNNQKEARDLTWKSVHSEYKVDGKSIIEVLQEWILSNTVQVQAPAIAPINRTYSETLSEDNFSKTAKLWAKANPTVVITLVGGDNHKDISPNWMFSSSANQYAVNETPLIDVIQDWLESKALADSPRVYDPSLMGDYFTATAKKWAQENPNVYVVIDDEENISINWAYNTSPDIYTVNDVPLLDVLQDWIEEKALANSPRVYDPSLMGDYFITTAREWAQENPTAQVYMDNNGGNGDGNEVRVSLKWHYTETPTRYSVDGKPLLDVIQDWIDAKAVKAEVQPVEPAFPMGSLEDALQQVKEAGYVVCFDEECAKMDFAIDTVDNVEYFQCGGIVNRLEDKGFWICNKNNELETAMKDHLQNDGWIVYRDADANEEDTIDCLRLKGCTITPTKPKQWIVNAEAITKFTEIIEADTEEEAHEIMRQKYENGDLDNGLGNDAQFGLTGTSPV